MEKNHAVVSGATGLVGFHLCNRLLSGGWKVTALGRDLAILSELGEKGAIVVHLDLRSDLSEWPEFESGAYWFHCAAAVSGASNELLWEVNVEGTRKLIKCALANEAKYFVHTSSIAVYDLDTGRPFREDDELRPASAYGRSKLESEHLVIEELEGVIPFLIFRPPFIIGPRDRNFGYEIYRRLKRRKLPLVSREGRIGLIDARDLVTAYIEAVRIELQGIYNIQSHAVYFSEFVRKVSETTGVKMPRMRLPYSLAYATALGVETINKVIGRSPDRGLSRYRLKTLTVDRILDTSKLETVMAFHPRPWEKSVEDWWREELDSKVQKEY